MLETFFGWRPLGAYGSLLLILFLLLFFPKLWKGQIQKYLVFYGMVVTVVFFCNPFVVQILGRKFPPLSQPENWTGVLQLGILLPLAGTLLYQALEKEKQKKQFVIAAVVIFALAGSCFGMTKIPNVGQEAYHLVKDLGDRELTIIAEEKAQNAIEGRLENVKFLYGRDLYTPAMDLGIADGYEPDMYQLYEACKNPASCMQDIVNMAGLYDCNSIIIEVYEDFPEKVGKFALTGTSEHYLLYQKK